MGYNASHSARIVSWKMQSGNGTLVSAADEILEGSMANAALAMSRSGRVRANPIFGLRYAKSS